MANRCTCNRDRRHAGAAWHAGFLKLVPDIRRYAGFRFRYLGAEAQEEAVAEVLADALIAYVRLDSLGKADLAYATPLAHFAIGRFQQGRRVAEETNADDVLSMRCRRRKGVVVRHLHRRDERTGQWHELLLEDRSSTPAQIAATRLDFASWLDSLSTRDRQIAETLAMGETTGRVARMFRISAGRVSQLRRDLCDNWRRFVGDFVDASAPSTATA